MHIFCLFVTVIQAFSCFIETMCIEVIFVCDFIEYTNMLMLLHDGPTTQCCIVNRHLKIRCSGKKMH